jgi:3-methyladenine DNA glycosylase AlkD
MAMSMNCSIQFMTENLQRHADPSRSPAMVAYMRGQFQFLGIAAPLRRQVCKSIIKELQTVNVDQILAIVEELWCLEHREFQYLAVDILASNYRKFDLPQISFLLKLAQTKSWWDSVDGLVGVVGDVLRLHLDGSGKGQSLMDDALLNKDFWIRRIALLHQLGWREKTDVNRLFQYALSLGGEREFFIRKAIGWSLRDYAWHAPKEIQYFLKTHHNSLSTLSVREASKNLAEKT